MRIVVPIDNIAEFMPLKKCGADDFYCGIKTDGIILGSRQYTQCVFSNLKELEELIKMSNNYKSGVFLALNSPRIKSKKELTIISKRINNLKTMGVAGFIVANMEIMRLLKKMQASIVASSLFGASNAEDIRLLKEIGANKIILDRHVALTDIKKLTRMFPSTKFEVFGMFGMCKGIEHICNHPLALSDNFFKFRKHSRQSLQFPHICFMAFKVFGSKLLDKKKRKLISDRLQASPYLSCGLCSLYYFSQLGISSVKVVGRGSSLEVKKKNVTAVKEALLHLKSNPTKKSYFHACRKIFYRTFGQHCQQKYCYYPDRYGI